MYFNIVACRWRVGHLAYLLDRMLNVPILDKIQVITSSSNTNVGDICRRFGVDYLVGNTNNLAVLFNTLLDKTPKGEWILSLSDDEIPSDGLLSNLEKIMKEADKERCNVVKFPYKEIFDGIVYRSIPNFYAEKMYKNEGGIRFFGITHLQILPIRAFHSSEYIYHIKSVNQYIFGNIWASLLYPAGHNSRYMEEMYNLIGGDSLDDVMDKIMDGKLSDEAFKYMVEKKEEDFCLKCLYWYYVLFREGAFDFTDDDIYDYLSYVLGAYRRILNVKRGLGNEK